MNIKNSIISLSSLLIIIGCSTGSGTSGANPNYSQESFVIMPINSTTCNSGSFYAPDNMSVNTNFGSSSYCLPYVAANNPGESVSQQAINGMINYYYGANASLATTCAPIGYKSATPIPESSPYAAAVQQTVTEALSCLQDAYSHSTSSKPMIVFDIDDTLTSSYIAGCQNGFSSYDPSVWHEAIVSSAFTRVPYMAEVLDFAFRNEIRVAFVTGRSTEEITETESNLITAYPEFSNQLSAIFSAGDTAFRTPETESWTVDVFKNNARQQLIERGNTILLNMGDQYSDLNYIYQYSNQPKCSYKLPNYMYYIQ